MGLFIGSTKKLHELLDKINKINPTIQLTMNHTSLKNESLEDRCSCKETYQIPFLDTLLSIKEGKIDIDLYKKESDRNQYLLPTSCHSKHTTRAIPYSLSLRIVRICIDPHNREKRFQELKMKLIERGYQEKVIDSAINKARKVPRKVALRKASHSSLPLAS